MAERDDLRQQLPAHVLGGLPADQATELEAALRSDAELAREAAELHAVLAAVTGAAHEALDVAAEPLDEALTERVLDAVGRGSAGSGGSRVGAPADDPDAVGGTEAPTVISVSSAHLAAAPLGHGAPEPGVRRGRRSATPRDEGRVGSEGRDRDQPAPERIDRGALRWSRIAIPVAAVLLAVVVVVGVWQGGTTAPGLGVGEDVTFEVVAAGLEVDARLVPHTWGTEVYLNLTGTIDGEIYRVELEDGDGGTVSAGTFIGDADLEVVSIMNGAVLREDTVAVVVTTDDGEPVMRAELDAVDFVSA